MWEMVFRTVFFTDGGSSHILQKLELLLLFFFFTHLHTCFGKWQPQSQSLPVDDVGILRLLEGPLEIVELLSGESRSRSSNFSRSLATVEIEMIVHLVLTEYHTPFADPDEFLRRSRVICNLSIINKNNQFKKKNGKIKNFKNQRIRNQLRKRLICIYLFFLTARSAQTFEESCTAELVSFSHIGEIRQKEEKQKKKAIEIARLLYRRYYRYVRMFVCVCVFFLLFLSLPLLKNVKSSRDRGNRCRPSLHSHRYVPQFGSFADAVRLSETRSMHRWRLTDGFANF